MEHLEGCKAETAEACGELCTASPWLHRHRQEKAEMDRFRRLVGFSSDGILLGPDCCVAGVVDL